VISAPSRWSSNLLFLIIAVGTEAGIANVWKFSYLAGANGGGLFVALYFAALVVIAIPALMAEMMIGRHGGRSVIGTMQVLVARDGLSRGWKIFGVLATSATFLILSYYCVICGWMLKYFVFGLSGGFSGITAHEAAQAYRAMLASPGVMLGYSGAIVALTALVVAGGVNKGIERVSGVLTPLRFVILFLLLIYSIGFADIGAAFRFLFTIDWSRLTPAVVVTAAGQAFFSLGIGVGVMLTMGAYMKAEYSIPRAVFTVAFAQGLVALIKDGADWIKIAISGGISDSRGSISAAPMTDEEMSTLIEVAHRNGIKVTAHNGSSEAARQALRFGIDGFEHGYHLDLGVLKEMKAKGVWLVPTIVVTQPGALEFYHKIGSPPWYLERVRITGADHWAMLQNAIKLGVKIALGTDQFPFEPNDGTIATVAEAELYVKAGMTPLQALQSATTQSALMLGMDADLGSLGAGKFADIDALDADPLKDIHALRNIGFVMKGGVVVRDDRAEYEAR
jgi:hypothetical protein